MLISLEMNSFLRITLRLCVSAVIFSGLTTAQTLAPGGPGGDAHWMTAAKQAIGTSATTTSKVWFTLANGAMTEVYYPDVTTANVQLLQFFVVNQKTGAVQTEISDTNTSVDFLNEKQYPSQFTFPKTP